MLVARRRVLSGLSKSASCVLLNPGHGTSPESLVGTNLAYQGEPWGPKLNTTIKLGSLYPPPAPTKLLLHDLVVFTKDVAGE